MGSANFNGHGGFCLRRGQQQPGKILAGFTQTNFHSSAFQPFCFQDKGRIPRFILKARDNAQLFQRGGQFSDGAAVHARRAVHMEPAHA